MPPQTRAPGNSPLQKPSFMTEKTRRQSAACSSPARRGASHRNHQLLGTAASRQRRRWAKWNCVNLTLLIAGGALATISAVFLLTQSGFAASPRAANMSESPAPKEVFMVVNKLLLAQTTPTGRPWRILRTVKHDPSCFTQGLELLGNHTLFEACGIYGQSRLRMYRTADIQNARNKIAMPAKETVISHHFFAEGVTIEGDQIHMLTWKENIMISYDVETLKEVSRIEYPLDGWGIAYDIEKKLFYATDGSSNIYWLQRLPTSMVVLKVVPVTCHNMPVPKLNELEFDQKNRVLYANVWYSTKLYKLDVVTGVCEAVYDMKPLLEPDADSMNGIALVYKELDTPDGTPAAALGETSDDLESDEDTSEIASSTLSPVSKTLSDSETEALSTNTSDSYANLDPDVPTALMWVTGKLWKSMHLVELFP